VHCCQGSIWSLSSLISPMRCVLIHLPLMLVFLAQRGSIVAALGLQCIDTACSITVLHDTALKTVPIMLLLKGMSDD